MKPCSMTRGPTTGGSRTARASVGRENRKQGTDVHVFRSFLKTLVLSTPLIRSIENGTLFTAGELRTSEPRPGFAPHARSAECDEDGLSRRSTVSQLRACRCYQPKPIEPQLEPDLRMALFNRVFSTQRLLQIIVVLGAAVLMKLFA